MGLAEELRELIEHIADRGLTTHEIRQLTLIADKVSDLEDTAAGKTPRFPKHTFRPATV
jgi:hypothetical protein